MKILFLAFGIIGLSIQANAKDVAKAKHGSKATRTTSSAKARTAETGSCQGMGGGAAATPLKTQDGAILILEINDKGLISIPSPMFDDWQYVDEKDHGPSLKNEDSRLALNIVCND